MMRYMSIQGIKLDPAWNNGDYTVEPVEGLRLADTLILVMGSAPLVMQKQAPSSTWIDTGRGLRRMRMT